MRLNWDCDSQSKALNYTVAAAKLGGAFFLTRLALRHLPPLAPALAVAGCALSVADLATSGGVEKSRQWRWSVMGPLIGMEAAALLASGWVTRRIGLPLLAGQLFAATLYSQSYWRDRDNLSEENSKTLQLLASNTDDPITNGAMTLAKLATGCIGMSLFLWGTESPTTLLTVSSLALAIPSLLPARGEDGHEPRNFPLYKMGLVSLIAGMQIAILLKTYDSMGWIWNSNFGTVKHAILIPTSLLTLIDLGLLKGTQGCHTALDYFDPNLDRS
jgi:hypothetical protein